MVKDTTDDGGRDPVPQWFPYLRILLVAIQSLTGRRPPAEASRIPPRAGSRSIPKGAAVKAPTVSRPHSARFILGRTGFARAGRCARRVVALLRNVLFTQSRTIGRFGYIRRSPQARSRARGGSRSASSSSDPVAAPKPPPSKAGEPKRRANPPKPQKSPKRRDRGLKPQCVGMYVQMANEMRERGEAGQPSNKAVAQRVGCSESTASRALGEIRGKHCGIERDSRYD